MKWIFFNRLGLLKFQVIFKSALALSSFSHDVGFTKKNYDMM